MKRVTFVCHGNICRSPAAEYIFLDMIKKANRENEFIVTSKATSYEEIGNDIYPPMKRALLKRGIKLGEHYSRRFAYKDYEDSDYIFYMDQNNFFNLIRIKDDEDHKYMPIYKWTPGISYIEDPWYSGNYELVIDEIIKCVKDILEHI